MDKIRLFDYYSDVLYLNNGFFTGLYNYITLNNLAALEFLTSTDDALRFDEEYFMLHSGAKYQSILFQRLVEKYNQYDMSSLFRIVFASIIYKRFSEKWNRIYNAMFSDYDPISNYDSHEVTTYNTEDKMTYASQNARTNSASHSITTDSDKTVNGTDTTTLNDTHTDTKSGTDKISTNKDADTIRYVLAFNSDATEREAERTNESGLAANNYQTTEYGMVSTIVNTGTDATLHTASENLDVSETGTNSETGTDSKTGNDTGTKTGTVTIEKNGNIGVTTSQQMIESELELRKHDFMDIVYSDIDSLFASNLYI